MDPVDIGLVQRALITYRLIETKPSGSRSAMPGEIKAATLLDEAPDEDYAFIRNLLLGQGLHLFRYSQMDMPGIKDVAYGVVHIDQSSGAPGLLTSKTFFEALKQRRAFRDLPSNTALAAWWMVLWLTAMGRLYQDRHWGEVSKFSLAVLDGEVFAADVHAILSRAQEMVVRGTGTWLCAALVGDDGTRRPSRSRADSRCFDFLQAMAEAGWLSTIGDDRRYRQTLLGAVDVAEKMRAQFAPLLPSADVLAASANILMNVDAPGDAVEEDTNVCDPQD